jgi:two-component system sensor kinase FixL
MVIKDILVESNLDPHLPAVLGDKIQLQQVILNLVVNAADAINTANADTRKITIQTGKSGEQNIRVSIKDTGPGIDAEQITRIFDPFYTTKTEGVGIGLSIVKTIIEAHGGTVGAENNPDRGAAFWFTLPIDTT